MESKKLKTRSDIHLARKLWHFFGVIGIVVCYHNTSRDSAIQALAIATFLFVGIDLLRRYLPKLNETLVQILQPIMRDNERNNLAGTTYLLAGVFLIVFLFPKDIVVLSLLFLAIADPLASYFGLMYGKDKLIGRKSLQGSLAAFFVCMLISSLYFYFHGLMVERLFIVSLLAGFIGAASELIPFGKLDDNFSFPVTSSAMLWLLFTVFGGL